MKFLWNGIKTNDGKLWRAFYSDAELTRHPKGTLTIYARDYGYAPREICEAFKVENNSDSMVDYFEKSHIRVGPDHPLYAEVKAAALKQQEHSAKREAKRLARMVPA